MADWIARDDMDERYSLDTNKLFQQQQEDALIKEIASAFGSASKQKSATGFGKTPPRGAHPNKGAYGPGSLPAGGSYRGGSGNGSALAGGVLGGQKATVVSAAEELGNPDLWAALATQGINYGKGGVGAFENQDNIRQAVAPNADFPDLARWMANSTGGHSSGGFQKTAYNPGSKKYNEYEQRARDGRQNDFERQQRALDEALTLRYEQLRRDQLLKTLQKFLMRRGMGGNTRTSTTEGVDVTNVGGLPVRIPTTTKTVETMPIPWESILSLLR